MSDTYKVYEAELQYVANILAVVLGKERFDHFAEFIDGDGDHQFSEIINKKNSQLNPEKYAINNLNEAEEIDNGDKYVDYDPDTGMWTLIGRSSYYRYFESKERKVVMHFLLRERLIRQDNSYGKRYNCFRSEKEGFSFKAQFDDQASMENFVSDYEITDIKYERELTVYFNLTLFINK